MSKRASKVRKPQGKCPINDYSQRYLALPLPGSRLNARNSPGARPYCNQYETTKATYSELFTVYVVHALLTVNRAHSNYYYATN